MDPFARTDVLLGGGLPRARGDGPGPGSGGRADIPAPPLARGWTGCRPDEKVGLGQAKRAYAPSLDRIDPEGLYTADNCRLVMVAVNFALNAWGEEVYLRLARAAVRAADEGK